MHQYTLTLVLGFAVLQGCTPIARTVVSVSMGRTGCRAQDLLVFDYASETSTWTAVCNESAYVCSTARSGSCTIRNAQSVDSDLYERASLLRTLPPERRSYFLKYAVTAVPWDQLALRVALFGAMTDKELPETGKGLPDLNRLEIGTPERIIAEVRSCFPKRGVVQVSRIFDEKIQSLVHSRSPRACVAKLASDEYIRALEKDMLLAPALNDIKPLPRAHFAVKSSPPKAADREPASTSDIEQAPMPVDMALDGMIRGWLNSAAADVMACTEAKRLTLAVDIAPSGEATITLAGAERGSPIEGCVRAAVAPHSFERGPAKVIHVVKQQSQPSPE